MARRDIYTGKEIGNYRIEQRIADGSFGTVYLARHLHLKERTTAVKILHAVHLDSDPEKEQFLQEAQILERLKGLPNILPLLDVGFDGNFPYMITDYAERGSLRMHMRQYNGPLPLQEVLEIIGQVGKGLQSAHDKGVVHRDLKPENILFNAQGEALLADFGISTILSTTSLHPTHVAGTPAYMAPEQFRSKVCKESDQYALACIAYELLTGRKLFEAPDLVSMGFLHLTEPPTPPRQLNPRIPPSVEHVLLKALSKQRTQRYPSVSAFVAALNNQAPAQATIDKTRNGAASGSNIDNGDYALPPVQVPSPTAKLPGTSAETGAVTPTPRHNTSNVVAAGTEGAVNGARATRVLNRTGTRTGEIAANRPTRDADAGGTRSSLRDPSAVDSRGQGTGGTTKLLRSSSKRNRRASIIVALVIVILLVLSGGGWAVSAHPEMFPFLSLHPLTTVTITPASKTVQDSYVLPSVDGNSNIANREVGVRQLTSTKTATDMVNATGHAQTQAQVATGTLTFINAGASFGLAGGTTIDGPNGVRVATNNFATIPAAVSGVSFGRMSVQAHATNAGAAGNMANAAINTLTCCRADGSITVTSGPFTGGQDAKNYTFLQSGDVMSVTNTLKNDAENDIKGQIKSGEKLLGDINCQTSTDTAGKPVGDKGVNVTSASVTHHHTARQCTVNV